MERLASYLNKTTSLLESELQQAVATTAHVKLEEAVEAMHASNMSV